VKVGAMRGQQLGYSEVPQGEYPRYGTQWLGETLAEYSCPPGLARLRLP